MAHRPGLLGSLQLASERYAGYTVTLACQQIPEQAMTMGNCLGLQMCHVKFNDMGPGH